MSTAFLHFIDIGDLVSSVLAFLLWAEVVRAAKINHAWRENVQALVTVANAQLLQQFLHPDHHKSFWKALHHSNSAISGELPLSLLLNFPTMPETVLPMVEIITPKTQFSVMNEFFRQLDYKVVRYLPSILIVRTGRTTERKVYFAKIVNHVSSMVGYFVRS